MQVHAWPRLFDGGFWDALRAEPFHDEAFSRALITMGKHEWFRWLIISIPSVIAGGVAGQFMAAWSAGALGVSIGVAASFALSKWEQRRGSSREDMAQIRGLSDREATDFIAIVEEALK